MQGNSDQERHHRLTDDQASGHRRGSSPPFQERGEEFADWVGKPLSALRTEGSLSNASHVTKEEYHKPAVMSDDQEANLEKRSRSVPPDGSGAPDAYPYHPSGWYGPPGDDSSSGNQ